jgi:hypothetical protein
MKQMVVALNGVLSELRTISELKRDTWAIKARERIDVVINKLADLDPFEESLKLYELSLQVGKVARQEARTDYGILLKLVQTELLHASDRSRNVWSWFRGLRRPDLDAALSMRKKADLIVDALGTRIETALDRLGDRLEVKNGTQKRTGRVARNTTRHKTINGGVAEVT